MEEVLLATKIDEVWGVVYSYTFKGSKDHHWDHATPQRELKPWGTK
jgi:hypothetical protein